MLRSSARAKWRNCAGSFGNRPARMKRARQSGARQELSDFLKTRRARLTPADAGLPAGEGRRIRGLRREEVAALAGVGLTWYTWLEQGREIRVSTAFLENLARSLKLTAAE